MQKILIYAELHWSVARPELHFEFNGVSQFYLCSLQNREQYVDQVIYTLNVPVFESNNLLTMSMRHKTNDLITDQSDHWVNIVNIEIDQIPADQLLLKNSWFKHAMPKHWCDQMQQQGIDIKDEYRPGTHIRLNGTCGFEFQYPFLFQKIINEWHS